MSRRYKVVSVVGARPQFIKAAPISQALSKVAHEVLVHTGQHYDHEMSAVFFQELQLPEPAYNLGVGSGSHGWQTGQMLARIEEVLLVEQPDWVLVYGDTNSTLAGALAAVKLQLPLAHVEAGLRSYNRRMPEEHNRVLTDHCADLLFCPTQTAVENLAREAISHGVHFVGDVMYDAVLRNAKLAEGRSLVIERLGLRPGGFALATVHRPRNTDDPARLAGILGALQAVAAQKPVVLPIHPRTKKALDALEYVPGPALQVIPPVSYLDMLMLEKKAALILTDSGGVQKEAFFFSVPCLTLREETEWPETVQSGWNQLVGADQATIVQAAIEFRPTGTPPHLFGNGHAAESIVDLLTEGSI